MDRFGGGGGPGARDHSVPALPGATKICRAPGDCASFQASACSRPPLPTTRIFNSASPHAFKDGLAAVFLEKPVRYIDRILAGETRRTVRIVEPDSLLDGFEHSRQAQVIQAIRPDALAYFWNIQVVRYQLTVRRHVNTHETWVFHRG